jgi:hypothetical protein
MIVQFADYAALKKNERRENQVVTQVTGLHKVIDLSAWQEFAAYEKAKARVQEAAAKLDW